jgi:hypothetical protein
MEKEGRQAENEKGNKLMKKESIDIHN